MGNFDFLLADKDFSSFATACIDAEKIFPISTSISALSARRALELAVKWMYQFDRDLRVPYRDNLSSLINERDFKEIINNELLEQLRFIVKLGNLAAHDKVTINSREAVVSLHYLFQFVNWIDYSYGEAFEERTFDENLLTGMVEAKVTESEVTIQNLVEQSEQDKPLKEEQKAPEVQESFAQKRLTAANRFEQPFKVEQLNEKETRQLLIDVELRLAGWTIDKDCMREEPVEGLKNITGKGYCDYILYGKNGKPLAVVEAKRASVSPQVGKEQVRQYVDLVEKKFGQRPVYFYTNGLETWFVEDDYPERRVSGFYSQDELQLLVDRRETKKSLEKVNDLIQDNISNRDYQKTAIARVCDAFEHKQRQALLVMATGSGKTRTAISLVDVLTKKNWVKNVLFLADRTSLVTQAFRNFNKLLPNLSLCNLLENKGNDSTPLTSRMVFSTYPTMMNAIDSMKTDKGRGFTVGHFDLVIIDEAHRSIYQKYKAIFDYFDSLTVGLTATPSEHIDKNTYDFFDLENGVPTFAYDLDEAVKDKFLVDYRTYETKLKLPTDGLRYEDLSDEDKAHFETVFGTEEESIRDIDSAEFNKWIFNRPTVEIVLKELMEKGQRTGSGDDIGKTIIFAKNHRHAEFIREVFTKLYPHLGSDYAEVIDYSVKHYQDLIDKFSNKEANPRIAISVDMLDTGIDVPEVVNLVFFKKVRSKIKFWQMIGRGTRLCEDLFAPGHHKENFTIFDYGQNFKFFSMNPKGKESQKIVPLTQKLYKSRLEIIYELQHIAYQNQELQDFRQSLITDWLDQLRLLDEENFQVRNVLEAYYNFRQVEHWQTLTASDVEKIGTDLSPLILADKEDDELAKRFDLWTYQLMLAQLRHKDGNVYKKQIYQTAQELSKLGTIPQVLEQKATLQKVQEDEFWANAGILDMDKVRLALRDLLQYLVKENRKIFYTNFDDEILTTVMEDSPNLQVNDLRSYREKVQYYLQEHLELDAIYKLHHNLPLSKEDLEKLETIFWTELGSRDSYEKEFKDKPLLRLIREMIGLERSEVNKLFSEFLSHQGLTVNQISFVNLVKDYIEENGYLDKKRLQEAPFKTFGGVIQLFNNNKKLAQDLIAVIDKVNAGVEVAS